MERELGSLPLSSYQVCSGAGWLDKTFFQEVVVNEEVPASCIVLKVTGHQEVGVGGGKR